MKYYSTTLENSTYDDLVKSTAPCAQPPKRMGRRPAGSDTRQSILKEARRLFGQGGFKATSLRQIADAAGVDVALISHYFGSKQGLFDELTRLPFDPTAVVAELTAPGVEGLGERTILLLLRHIREESEGQTLVTLLRSSGGHTEIGAAIKLQYVRNLLEPLARYAGQEQPELRAALCASQLLGFSFAEQVLGLESLKSADTARLARIIGASLQRYLTADLN